MKLSESSFGGLTPSHTDTAQEPRYWTWHMYSGRRPAFCEPRATRYLKATSKCNAIDTPLKYTLSGFIITIDRESQRLGLVDSLEFQDVEPHRVHFLAPEAE
jgi:hypothetical protein